MAYRAGRAFSRVGVAIPDLVPQLRRTLSRDGHLFTWRRHSRSSGLQDAWFEQWEELRIGSETPVLPASVLWTDQIRTPPGPADLAGPSGVGAPAPEIPHAAAPHNPNAPLPEPVPLHPPE